MRSEKMPTPFLLGAMLSGGGFLGGTLSRQPEINSLKEQVKTLQAEIQRLQIVIKEQDRQIGELKIRYNTLKAYHFTEKARQKMQLKGAVMFQYCFKEYMDLLVAGAHSDSFVMKDEEIVFFNIFDKMINNKEATLEEKIFLREYIRHKYAYQIDNMVECDMENLIEKVESVNVA
jgi:outer membrane murein-binding lipoprotein Lpp